MRLRIVIHHETITNVGGEAQQCGIDAELYAVIRRPLGSPG